MFQYGVPIKTFVTHHECILNPKRKRMFGEHSFQLSANFFMYVNIIIIWKKCEPLHVYHYIVHVSNLTIPIGARYNKTG